MTLLVKGQRLNIREVIPTGSFQVGLVAGGLPVDFACFSLDSAGKLSDDRYMTFFNQTCTPCGGVAVCNVQGDAAGFAFQLQKLPASIERVVVAASVSEGGTMSLLRSGYLRIIEGEREHGRFSFAGSDFSAERALMLGEFYRKEGVWRFMAVGQGFDGGLDALVTYFGGSVADDPLPAAAKVSLEKKIASAAPQLVNLHKAAGVSLQKAGLEQHRARVCLCLDISGSMSALYKKGLVQAFADRILALACQFDDDGAIDVFLFGEKVHQPAPMELSNCQGYIQQIIQRHPLEGDTRYGRAMEAIRKFYFPENAAGECLGLSKAAQPVYVMFVTDGSTSDKALTEKQLRWSSKEPIFWQFMGIGKGRKSKNKRLLAFADSDFPFLESLDDLPGRLIDNADYFSLSSPDECSDAALYDLLMTEYPGWLKLAAQHGLI
ncbi:VWA domain-containing protein [Iodobacter ciconiae]|uniref:VWFA domain-containing protein n=1 Tax=Iodobacter ciconiae TaxID=2496266 RepID=A0A3S8ZU34_9NEIS|nr:VWA domain-containing protein [Iodobacter ciconiae]AZN36954.1 hypothetical protein EJO50_10945 [Iodobacter ciconiae]